MAADRPRSLESPESAQEGSSWVRGTPRLSEERC